MENLRNSLTISIQSRKQADPRLTIQRCKDRTTAVQGHPLCGYKGNTSNSQQLRRTLPPVRGVHPWAQTLVLLGLPGPQVTGGGGGGVWGRLENRRAGRREASLPPRIGSEGKAEDPGGGGGGGCTSPCVRHSASSGPGTSSGRPPPPRREDFAPAYPRPCVKKYLPQHSGLATGDPGCPPNTFAALRQPLGAFS